MATGIQISSSVETGPFGIADSSGKYTFYTTFQSAINAASVGQTVEMFADVTETSAVTVTLKNGVNVNGNGHTYTLNVAGVTNALSVANGTTFSGSVINLNTIRTGSTSDVTEGCAMYIGSNVTCEIDFTGSKFTNLGSGVGICINFNTTGNISNAVAKSKSTFGGYFVGSSVNIMALNNCIGYGYSGGTGIRLHNGGTANGCYGSSDSGVGFFATGTANNCIGVSSTGTGFQNAGAVCSNCTGRSISGKGYIANSAGYDNLNCTGISVSGIGMDAVFAVNNCCAISSSNAGLALGVNVGQAIAHNTYAKSSTSYAVLGGSTSKLYGCTIISAWNNAAGYGVRGNSGSISDTIVNCSIILSNASAPYLFNDNIAQAISMAGNTYRGGTTFNANLTQAVVATEDSQGNIYL